uniref:IgGFc-binding protein N-terminal domain-containing protein n=1 Tax=Ascaris lumbricoides TaxID=6252 RepID=A0A9J2PXG0_ASCLU
MHKIRTFQDDQLEIEMITYEVKPYVSGIRVVSLPNQNGFISYTEAGVSLIYPDTKVRIVIFGYHLDKIGVISLTTDNCFNSLLNVTHSEFLIQTVKRLDFLAYFAELMVDTLGYNGSHCALACLPENCKRTDVTCCRRDSPPSVRERGTYQRGSGDNGSTCSAPMEQASGLDCR